MLSEWTYVQVDFIHCWTTESEQMQVQSSMRILEHKNVLCQRGNSRFKISDFRPGARIRLGVTVGVSLGHLVRVSLGLRVSGIMFVSQGAGCSVWGLASELRPQGLSSMT